jgi:hypothetical protein
VGLVNWEEEPFQELLESLLGKQTDTLAHNSSFTDAARDGVRAQFASMDDGGPGVRHVLAQESPASQGPQQTLPFQGPTRGPVAGPTIQPAPPVVGGQSVTTPPPPREPAKPSAATATPPKKKPFQQADTSDLRKPKPYKPAQPSTPAGKPIQPAPSPAGGGKARPSDVPTPQASPIASGGQGGALPPLPPAMPYSRSAPSAPTTQQSAPILPDENGTVTARIPGGLGDAGMYTGQRSSTGLPPAQPVSSRNPIGGFILDSFKPSSGQSETVAPQPLRPAGGGQPATSVIDQMGRDVRQLGSGIRDTFSRILPGGK